MSENQLKRVKLSFKDDRLVMPVAQVTGKVSALLSNATIRFRAQRLLGKEDSFIQIRTADGYIINPNDNIEEVIEQNDHLVLVNRATWIADFKKTCQPTYWFGIRQYDYKSCVSRDISVSYAASKSALCITLWKGDETLGMEVFDRDILTSYGKDGDVLVMHVDGTQDGAKFEQSAYFVVKNAVVTAVRLHCKTFSDPQTQIEEWPITVGESEVTHGEVHVVQRNWPDAPAKEYTLPPTVRTGKLLEADTPLPVRDLVADPNVSTGDSPLIYTQLSQVCPEKYISDKVHQHFRVEFSVTNNSELDTHISRIAAEYQAQDGKWVKVPFLTQGSRTSDYNWRMSDYAGGDPLCIASRGVVKFSLGARLDLPAQTTLSNRSYSIDSSLPAPFQLRFTFTDQDQKSSSIAVSCTKRGLELPSLESIIAHERSNAQKYFYVDDLTNSERFGAYYVLGGNDNYVRIVPESSYYNLDSTTLHSYTTKAIEAKTPEWSISSYTSGKYTGSIHLLIDLEARYAYGVRIRLATPDGSLDESFLLPKDKW